MKPIVSILMPVYNCASYIEETIESIINSTFQKWELLIVDDENSDNTRDLINSYCLKDNRVKLFPRPHSGISHALNFALKQAEGNYVARIDGDDLCTPTRFEKQVHFLDNNPSVSLVSGQITALETKPLSEGFARYLRWVNQQTSHDDIYHGLLWESPLIHPSVMVRKEVLLSLNGYREYEGPEDYDLWLRMAERGSVFAKIPENVLFYRIHGDNTSFNDMFHYGKKNFFRRKIPFIIHFLKQSNKNKRDIHICGFTTEGKVLCEHFQKENIHIKKFIDISSKNHGKSFLETTVFPLSALREEISSSNPPFLIITIQNWERKEQFTHYVQQFNYELNRDFIFV